MRTRAVALLLALVLATGGGTLASLHLTGERRDAAQRAAQQRVDQQQRQDAVTAAELRRRRGGTDGFQSPIDAGAPAVSAAKPTRVLIPSIGVDSTLERLERDARGVLGTPVFADEAGWWADGVVPGQVGAAVIVGHLDTIQGDAVFVDLRRLRPGDEIEVRMSDGRTVRYAVDRTHVVGKALFPSDEVYGAVPDSQLRLITCSEPFDPVAKTYTDNLVVYATQEA